MAKRMTRRGRAPSGKTPPRLSAAESATIAAAVTEILGRGGRSNSSPSPAKPSRRPASAHHGDRGTHVRRERIVAGQDARRLPYKATLGVAVAGYATWGLAELVERVAGATGHLAVTATAGTLAAIIACSVAVAHRSQLTGWRWRYWTATTVGLVWLVWASLVGIGWGMLAVLLVGAVALSARWQAAHQVPIPAEADTTPAPDPMSEGGDPGDEIAVLWHTNIARRGGVVASSFLTDREDLERAYRWTVQTRAGSTSFDELLRVRSKIAAGLRRASGDVQLEPHPADESKAKLTVVTSNILTDGIPYPGPRYHRGRIPVGPFADGTGEAEFIACDSAGCYGGLITGEPRSGKSACFENIGLSLRGSGRWFVVYLDGDPTGGSSPVMSEHMNWPEAGPEGALRQLAALEAALEVRGLLKNTLTVGPGGRFVPLTDPITQWPARKLLPSPDYPGIMWMIDELHRLSKDEWLRQKHGFVQRLENIVRIGPKYGLVVTAASHSLLVGDYGNSTVLRALLAARNMFAFRNQNKTETAVLNGLTIPPYALPEGGGYAYSAGSSRLAMLRAAWSEDMRTHATGLPDLTPDNDTRLALAEHWPDEERDPAKITRQAQSDLAAWRAAMGAGTFPPPAELPVDPGPDRLLHLVPRALDASSVVPQKSRLSANQQVVLDALLAGHTRSGVIVEETGLAPSSVSTALSVLEAQGLACKQGHGQWAAA